MPLHSGSSTRARMLGVGLLFLMFFAGALSGMAMTRAVEASPGPATTAAERDGAVACRDGGKRTKIIDQLDLSAEQRARVDAILARRRGQTESFWDSAGPRLRVLMDSTRAEIRAVLTPEQRAEYDRLREERRREREHDHDRRDRR